MSGRAVMLVVLAASTLFAYPARAGGAGGDRPTVRERIRAAVEQMKREGKTPEQIRQAVRRMIRRARAAQERRRPGPRRRARRPRGGPRPRGIPPALGERIRRLVAELKEQGKSPEEIRTRVRRLIEKAREGRRGVRRATGERRRRGARAARGRRGSEGRAHEPAIPPRLREQVRELVRDMKAAGKKPEEIRRAVREYIRRHAPGRPGSRGTRPRHKCGHGGRRCGGEPRVRGCGREEAA